MGAGCLMRPSIWSGMVAAGGNVPVGYFKDPEKSAQVFVEIHGVRYSMPGDFATVEADGSITYIHDTSVVAAEGIAAVDEPEAGFRPVKSFYYYPLGGALALAGLLCLVSLLQSAALRRVGGVQTDAG